MSKNPLPALPCMCSTLRRAARAFTQHYEEALRPLGLTVTHFTILQALSLAGEVTQRRLGEILAMDSTTLTRTLALMKRQGWLATRPGTDRRERLIRLSKAGEAELAAVLPHWETVQARLRAEVGDKRWDNLMNLINEVTATVTE
jgi:DNA-binding MarR family transcriptional regulator